VSNPTDDQLRQHLAYEVHYLVLAAHRFTQINCRDGAFYQDSSFIHGRNLLEFTNPAQRANRYAWWIGDVGGQKPPRSDPSHDDWREFINANATHLGPARLEANPWPVTKDKQRLLELARYLLQRVETFSQGSDPCAVVMQKLSHFGLTYLDDPTEDNLGKIAHAIDNPLPP